MCKDNEDKKEKPEIKVYYNKPVDEIKKDINYKLPEKYQDVVKDLVRSTFDGIKKVTGNETRPSIIPTSEYKHKSYHADKPEEMESVLKGFLPEKDLQKIMGLINEKINEVGKTPEKMEFSMYKSENDRQIVIIRTDTSTLIAPLYMRYQENSDSPSSSPSHRTLVIDTTNVTLHFLTDIQTNDGSFPHLIIPHECENHDNEVDLEKIIEFIKLLFPNNFIVDEEFDRYSGYDNLSVRFIKIKQ